MKVQTIHVAVFRLGRIEITDNARQSIGQEDVASGIRLHQAGDWGSVADDDRAANDRGWAEGRHYSSKQEGTR